MDQIKDEIQSNVQDQIKDVNQNLVTGIMKSNCPLRNVRIGHKKLNLPARFIRRLGNLDQVITHLHIHGNVKAFRLIADAVQSARQNLINLCNKVGVDFHDREYKVDVQIGRGSKSMKRYMPRAKGSANVISKETSHIFVFIDKIGVKNGK